MGQQHVRRYALAMLWIALAGYALGILEHTTLISFQALALARIGIMLIIAGAIARLTTVGDHDGEWLEAYRWRMRDRETTKED